jgi:hypothetical protein
MTLGEWRAGPFERREGRGIIAGSEGDRASYPEDVAEATERVEETATSDEAGAIGEQQARWWWWWQAETERESE